MAVVSVATAAARYDVHIEREVLSRLGGLVAAVAQHARCALIADERVFDLYGSRAKESLEQAGYTVAVSIQPSGESHKTLDTVRCHYDALVQGALERGSPVVSLGGGALGDTAGFAAATYLRGVPFIQCPTTLLAMVDASIGGKVGVNLPHGKNLVGSFHQPHAVIIDPAVLESLPARDFRSGLAECIKHGMIRDETLFAWIEANHERLRSHDAEALEQLLVRNVEIKAAVVGEDEREQGVRAHLNFGHTFAHAIEQTAGYGVIEHGEAVAVGMLAAARLAEILGLADRGVFDRLAALTKAVGLPTAVSDLASSEVLYEVMQRDKKARDRRIRFVLPRRIGVVELIDDATPEQVARAWDAVR